MTKSLITLPKIVSKAAFIPIKTTSKRVPGKNFRRLNGEPLYKYIISNTIESQAFDEIFIDTDSEEILSYAKGLSLRTIMRLDELAADNANGNDLLNFHHKKFPNFEYYFQLFATAPLLKPDSISKCVNLLTASSEADSILTVTKECGWFWFQGQPVNYDPKVLPRSQDAEMLTKESTGLYGIQKDALKKYSCRIGAKPIMHEIEPIESLDIDTEHEFLLAEKLAKDINIKIL